MFTIDRPLHSKKTLQVYVTVGPHRYPTIEIAPLVELKKFKFERRQGKSRNPYSGEYICTDRASLASSYKSPTVGGYAKSCTLCISRSPNGILLPSTASTEVTLT